MIYRITIEPDDIKEGFFMIVIQHSNNSNSKYDRWIPMRGVSKKLAEDSMCSIGYAFEFGAKAYSEELLNMDIHIQVKVNKCS